MKEFVRKHWAMIINIVLVLALGRYAFVKAWQAWQSNEFNFVEAAFAIHNIVMLTLILVRRQHVSIDRNIFNQIIALAAFFSGIIFQKHPTDNMRYASEVIMVIATILGIITLVNLGRSFGILIAVRQVKTSGLYRIIRHPMYFTDILWRIGYLVGNLYWLNSIIFLASSACYVYRALLEERFLSQFTEYQEYKKKVRYRFLPGLF
jgi:protein-S-isoprenylcysteine O-methyltransferase Ste14